MPNGPQPQADMEKTVKPFEDQTGVKVNVEVVGWDVQLDRIKNAAVSGQGPDVTQAGTTQVPFFAALGGFQNLNDRVADIGGKAAYAPGVWQTTQLQGTDGTFAVPWFTEARAIYYRKDVLKKAGIDPATAFTDVNAFQQTLQTIKDKVPTIGGKPISPFGMPGKKAFDLVHHVMPFVWDNGGAELNDDASKSTINSTQAAQGVDFVANLVTKGLFDKSMLERDGTQVENQFKGGRLAVWIGGPWVLSTDPPHRRQELGPGGARERRRGRDAERPGRQGVHLRRRLEPDDVQVLEEPERGLGAHQVPVQRRRPEELRGPAELLPGAPGAAGAGRQLRRQPQGVLLGHQGRPHLRAHRAVGADRERLQGPLRQHPRLRCGAGQGPSARARSSRSSMRRPRKPTPSSRRAASDQPHPPPVWGTRAAARAPQGSDP